jgi:hypothetical protein
MKTENFREAKWVDTIEPKASLGLFFVTLYGSPKKFQGGVPREFESVILASNGKIYKIRTDLTNNEVIKWEGYDGI